MRVNPTPATLLLLLLLINRLISVYHVSDQFEYVKLLMLKRAETQSFSVHTIILFDTQYIVVYFIVAVIHNLCKIQYSNF